MELLKPTALQQKLIDEINATSLHFGKFEIEKHPLLPNLKRYLVVYKTLLDLSLPRLYIYYHQILEDELGNKFPNKLPTPEWVINEDSFSNVRDLKTGEKILIALVDETDKAILNKDGTPKLQALELQSAKYLKYLENKGMTLSKIIANYVPDFYEKNKQQLNQLG